MSALDKSIIKKINHLRESPVICGEKRTEVARTEALIGQLRSADATVIDFLVMRFVCLSIADNEIPITYLRYFMARGLINDTTMSELLLTIY